MSIKNNNLFVLNVHTIHDSNYVHTASSIKKAKHWVKKHGQDWTDEDYCFYVYPITVDVDAIIDGELEGAVYIDTTGYISKYNPLY